ncbi:MAG: Ig-like domain-containing protein [Candidatus Limivivens sp.]|nr:Ig-like domain-containing protein [Candidatus Limivivens sp.]
MKNSKKKRFFSAVFAALFLLTSCFSALPLGSDGTVEAHSGRTDSFGGHHDYKNASGLGSYHYHCGGYPAHLHPNGVCPYASGSEEPASEPAVTPAPAPTPKLSKTTASLKVGKTLTLKLRNASGTVTWRTGKASVATVSPTGKITAKKAGICTIAAVCDGVKYTCRLTVVNPFKLEKTSLSLKVGKASVIGTNVKASSVKWSSSNPKIASVSAKGKVTAKKAGTCTITGTYMKKTLKCKVKVSK